MGITIKERKGIVWDRNAALVVIYCDDDDPDKWRILTQWQDAPYDGDTRVDTPRGNTDSVERTYAQIKDTKLPSGGTISDLLPKIKEAVYLLMQHKIDGVGTFAPAKLVEAPEVEALETRRT